MSEQQVREGASQGVDSQDEKKSEKQLESILAKTILGKENNSQVNDYTEKIPVPQMQEKMASQTPLVKTASKMEQDDSNDLKKASSIAAQRRVTLAP